MGKFVEKYVRTPLREIDITYRDLNPIQLINTDTEILIRVGSQNFSISRTGFTLDYEATNDSELTDE